ncbi:hypothetical protein ACRYCC_04245 [Actinomadura scrupuli]|uniref:hypothetical protein n=1 Tax=Actinomadura scrupuli TaxID=559629 RepID=UPI003D955A18
MSGGSLVVIGSGSLARALCHSIAVLVRDPVRVTVVARSEPRSRELCYTAETRARLGGGRAGFRAVPNALTDEDDLAAALTAAEPSLVVCCASRQSPWEGQAAPSAWTALLDAAGIAMALPLHTDLAWLAGRALARLPYRPTLVNACYPDAVNPLLRALGVPVATGVGNVGLLAASLQRELDLPDQSDLRVLGHHLHLHACADAADEAQAWLGGRPLAGVGDLLADQRAAARPELNAVTGHAAALLVRALLSGADLRTSLPGPLGLPGGYPVRVRHGGVELDLPAGLDRERAIARNQRWARREGVEVDGGTVAFAAPVRDVLAPHLGRWAGGFTAGETAGVVGRLLRLRDELRRHPAPAGHTAVPVAVPVARPAVRPAAGPAVRTQ